MIEDDVGSQPRMRGSGTPRERVGLIAEATITPPNLCSSEARLGSLQTFAGKPLFDLETSQRL